MKNLLRLCLLLVVLGLSLLTAAAIYPDQNAAIYNVSSGAHHLVFFTPGSVTIVITSLNQTAQLDVSPSGPSMDLANPLLNISVVNKELVTFTIQARGYYAITLQNSSASTGATFSYEISETGSPSDMLTIGLIICGIGISSSAGVFIRQKHWQEGN